MLDVMISEVSFLSIPDSIRLPSLQTKSHRLLLPLACIRTKQKKKKKTEREIKTEEKENLLPWSLPSCNLKLNSSENKFSL